LPILFELCLKQKPLRFNALQKLLFPVTPKILSKRLKEMEGEGLLAREEKAEGGLPMVEYDLTGKSRELLSTLKVLGEWSERWHGREDKGVKCPNVRRLSCAKL
jgi:DNA-binding HxlR family transcriptional regulator